MKSTERFILLQLLAASIIAMLFGVGYAICSVVVSADLFRAILFACIALVAYAFLYRPSINALRNLRDNKKGGNR